MKKYAGIFAASLVLFLAAINVHAQGGFTGPSATGSGFQSGGFMGQQNIFASQQGFMGPQSQVTVAQVVQTFPRNSQAVLRGHIVSHLGGDRYLFRDASGEIMIKIKHDRWWGLSVGPNDMVEIGVNVKRDKRTMVLNYLDVRSIRMSI